MKSNLSFPRQNRLTNKAEYQSVFDNAFKVNHKYLLVLYKPNQLENARLGMLIGKRAVSHAVERNRIKRIIRTSFRHFQEKLIGLDVVVIARQQCGTLNNTILREGIDHLWEKTLTQYQKSLL